MDARKNGRWKKPQKKESSRGLPAFLKRNLGELNRSGKQAAQQRGAGGKPDEGAARERKAY